MYVRNKPNNENQKINHISYIISFIFLKIYVDISYTHLLKWVVIISNIIYTSNSAFKVNTVLFPQSISEFPLHLSAKLREFSRSKSSMQQPMINIKNRTACPTLLGNNGTELKLPQNP